MTDVAEILQSHRERMAEIGASARESTVQLSKLNTDIIMLNGLAGSLSGKDAADIRTQVAKAAITRVSEVLHGPE